MNLRKLLTIIIISAGAMCSSAQTISTKHAHRAAHQQQLANAKLRMDKRVIQDFIKNDIERREDAVANPDKLSSESAAMINDLLSEAKNHLGKRYRSGAKGPNAFDCSGFSSYVYRQFGYSLGASSRDQFNQGEPVDKNKLRAGDLVFFTGRNRNKGVGHVGIVVSADNDKGTFKFIHASTSQGIKIDSSDGYYTHRYLGARRLISE